MALLMHLIEKNQIDIYDIPIALVTEQYLNYLKAMEEFNIEVASEFLVMAATLLQIKSRMLLPRPLKPEVLVEAESDPRQELVDRLIEYRKFKQVAEVLSTFASEREKYYTRLPQEFTRQFPLPEGLSLDDLLRAFADLIESKTESYAVIEPEEISIKDKMQDIVALLRESKGRVLFSKTVFRTGSRSETVAAFLAVLELIRLKRVLIYQEKSFDPIFLALKE